MFYLIVIVVIFSITAPAFISSLQCYQCLFRLNYTVTEDTFPSFADCPIIETNYCMLDVSWNVTGNRSSISAMGISLPKGNQDIVSVQVSLNYEYGGERLISQQSFSFQCASNDRCNNEINGKRVIRSLIIENQLRQQCSPLIEIIPTFNPQVTPCNNIDNSTQQCYRDDLMNCNQCYVYVTEQDSPSAEICAMCPKTQPYSFNTIRHIKKYQLNDRRVYFDYVDFWCQFERCNSPENVNRVFSASRIFFDLNKFANEMSYFSNKTE